MQARFSLLCFSRWKDRRTVVFGGICERCFSSQNFRNPQLFHMIALYVPFPIGSVCMLYVASHWPSIYPIYVSIWIPYIRILWAIVPFAKILIDQRNRFEWIFNRCLTKELALVVYDQPCCGRLMTTRGVSLFRSSFNLFESCWQGGVSKWTSSKNKDIYPTMVCSHDYGLR